MGKTWGGGEEEMIMAVLCLGPGGGITRKSGSNSWLCEWVVISVL